VSHNEHLISGSMDELWVVSQGNVAPFHGNDVDGSVLFFWGSDYEGNLVLSDDAEVVKKGCGKSFAPFPQELQENVTLLGNNILEDLQEHASLLALEVLRRYDHPLDKVKPVPRVDNMAKWTSLVLCSGHASWGYLKNVFVKFDTHGTGCFFTSSKGLRSYEHPPNEVKPVPWVDSSGQVCGATFKVDAETKKESSMPRVGSAVN
ncbi:hypothetical protein NL676_029452, partial [Syzygium grande]